MTLERLAEIEAVALRARDYPGKAMNVVAVPAAEMLALCAVVRTAPEAVNGRGGRESDAAGVGRISKADREAARVVGEQLTECAWIGIPKQSTDPEHWTGAAEIAVSVAAQVRAAGSGFGLALAEWLERWAGEQE